LNNKQPQAAVDCPRFCIKDGTAQGAISFEEGIHDEVKYKRACMHAMK